MLDFLIYVFLVLGILYLASEFYYNIKNIIDERKVGNAPDRPKAEDGTVDRDRRKR